MWWRPAVCVDRLTSLQVVWRVSETAASFSSTAHVFWAVWIRVFWAMSLLCPAQAPLRHVPPPSSPSPVQPEQIGVCVFVGCLLHGILRV